MNGATGFFGRINKSPLWAFKNRFFSYKNLPEIREYFWYYPGFHKILRSLNKCQNVANFQGWDRLPVITSPTPTAIPVGAGSPISKEKECISPKKTNGSPCE